MSSLGPHIKRWLLRRRVYLLSVAHLLLFALAFDLAFELRFDLNVPATKRALFWQSLPWVLITKLLVFRFAGSIHGWWRYVTFADLATLLRMSLLSTIAIALIDFVVFPASQIPRSVLLIDLGASILLIGGVRAVWRLVREHVWPSIKKQPQTPVLMIGACGDGEALVPLIHRNTSVDYRIVGFLDENADYQGTRLGGIPFLGKPVDVTQIAEKHGVEQVLVVSRSMSGGRLRKLIDDCSTDGIDVKMIPPIAEVLSGAYRLEVRDVEINDLLRRDKITLDDESLTSMLEGQFVLVSGAGGSIGSEICRQISKYRPERLVLVERSENCLFHIERELKEQFPDLNVCACLADVRDERRMTVIFEEHRPQIVFHAAAHKHVPMVEHNPGEAIANNVFGTRVLANLADAYSVDRFVMISTDKAVNPTSVMGVTKQIAERYVHAMASQSNSRFVVVRFGNVLASAGSVVPIFQDQIRRGGPITITHPQMRRFFMTIPEASQLVLQGAAIGSGGEIFVLDMGEQVRIMDLAKDLIRLSGLSSDDVEIRIIGTRPGEKLYEELYFDDEQSLETPHPKIRAAYHRPYDLAEVTRFIQELEELAYRPQHEIYAKLQEMIPEFQREQSHIPLNVP